MFARSSTLGRRSARHSHSSVAAFIAIVALVALLFPASNQPVARAADPKPQTKAEQCQKGLFKKNPPTKAAGCATATEAAGPISVDSVIPSGFQESVVWSGLVNPTVVRFAADGRIFVAEKSGIVKIFDNLSDTTPTSFTPLPPNVHNFWDRGLLGMALDPTLTGGGGNGNYVYLLYAYDHILGHSTGGAEGPPRWGDTCPTPPGATTDGCVVSGRLSRFSVSGNVISPTETVLIEDFCQQFPSHSIGSLVFGPDGALYLSSGDGASFNTVDYGQLGGTSGVPPVTPVNPCGDPSLEGGALRSQDVRNGGASGSSYASVVAADGAIAYWRLGETGTTVAADSRGTNTGTYTGSYTQGVPGAIAGDANGAVTLTGGTGYVAVPDANALDLANGPWSVELWAKRADSGTYYQLLYSKGSQGNVYFLNNKLTVDDDVDVFATESGTTTDSNWHHFVVTHAPGSTRIYKDGVDVTTTVNESRATSSNAIALNLGRYTFLNGLNFNGSLDEVAVYPTVLTGAKVAAHFSAGTTPVGGEPTSLDGSILRLNPVTGAGMAGNPFAGSADANSRRIIAYGLRNPFRITTRPGTNEIWVGDVGWNTWEEVNRIPNATDAIAENFGWPCYEGNLAQGGYDATNLPLCESLYSQGPSAVTAPILAYNHSAKVVAGETCPTGSSSITGMAFYPEAGGSFPASYAGGIFFADHSRNCIWFMPKGANGQPNPAAVLTFAAGAANPVDIVIGPDGALYYPNFDGGTIQKISAIGGGNQAPTASFTATPSSGAAPLTVQFNGSASSDPEGGALTYAWDLDGDGLYDDATGVTTQWTYTQAGNVTTALRVTDPLLATGTTTRLVSVGNTPPVPVIAAPTSALTWKVGDLVNFSGSASDAQDGNLPASALTWTLVLQHCPSNCHTHTIQTFPGVASGSFTTPDHEYPSYLELTLTATDTFGTQASTTVRLDPKTVVLTFQSAPTGLALAVNEASNTTPFTRTVIQGSSNSVSATTPQTLNGLTYTFASWSDGGAQSHQITAPATNTTYTATYTTPSLSFTSNADATIRSNRPTVNDGTSLTVRSQLNKYRAYVKFTVSGLSGAASNAKLRLWVAASSSAAGSIYLVGNSWTETGITWNNAPALPGSPIATGGAAPLGTWVEFNLGSVITGNGTYSFAVAGGTSDSVDYDSREASHDPTLVVTP